MYKKQLIRREATQWALATVMVLGGAVIWRLSSAQPVHAQDAGPDASSSNETQQTCSTILQGTTNTPVSAPPVNVGSDISSLLDKLSTALSSAHLNVSLDGSVGATASGSTALACCNGNAYVNPVSCFTGTVAGNANVGATVSVPGTAFNANGTATVTVHGTKIIGGEIIANANIDQGTGTLAVTVSGNDTHYAQGDACNCLSENVTASITGGLQFGPQVTGSASITIWHFHTFPLASIQLQGIVNVAATLTAKGQMSEGKGCGGNGAPSGSVSLGAIQVDSDLQGSLSVGPWRAQTIDWKPTTPFTVWPAQGPFTF